MASGNPAADNSTSDHRTAENPASKDRMTRREAILQLLHLTCAGVGTVAVAQGGG